MLSYLNSSILNFLGPIKNAHSTNTIFISIRNDKVYFFQSSSAACFKISFSISSCFTFSFIQLILFLLSAIIINVERIRIIISKNSSPDRRSSYSIFIGESSGIVSLVIDLYYLFLKSPS